MIESLQNKKVIEVANLKNKKNRDKSNLFLVEGERLVNEITDDFEIIEFFVSENYENKPINSTVVADNVFKKMCDTVNPQGILAVVKQKKYTISDVLNITNPFFTVLENISDPGNLGTLIRSADAFGANGIFLSKGCVDLYNPKTIRSTMGSIFHIPIIKDCDLTFLLEVFKEKNIKTYSAHLKTENFLYNMDFRKPTAILIGNEANGLTDEISKLSDKLVKIPLIGKAESFNASVAGSILMYEVVRQRMRG